MTDALAEEVRAALGVDSERFHQEVRADAAVIKEELRAGSFDNPQGNIGLEWEFYAVAGADTPRFRNQGREGSLARVPRRLLEYIGFEKELGLHNAEMSTTPQPLNDPGLRAQETEVTARLSAAMEPLEAEGLRLVSDGMWTIPPDGETADDYLTDSVQDGDITLATNMSESPRYHAMANAPRRAGMEVDAPNVSLQADTVMPESLITSIQPHYQVPQAEALPTYFNYALRVAAPLLAIAVNSPFFPPDLYDTGTTPADVLNEGWAEGRVSVFESVLNPSDGEKVRFPPDATTAAGIVDRIAADEQLIPLDVERGTRFDDQFAYYRTKHGTYWRWVRPVFEGATRTSANARIEFRPLPAQPTITDVIAFQAAFGGLMAGLRRQEHPLSQLDWATAERNFYAAAREGYEADIEWITLDGARTTERSEMYDDLLGSAQVGLEAHGLSERQARRYLDPLRERVESAQTPAGWKRDRMRQAADDGKSLSEAIETAQRAYITRQAETLWEGRFSDWLQ